jgi:hypothetical protein
MGQLNKGLVASAMVTIPKTHGPDTPLNEIRSLFEDEHFHIALIVGDDGRLITTIERSDLDETRVDSIPVFQLGTLAGRTIGPTRSVEDATSMLTAERRRRLAVIDDAGGYSDCCVSSETQPATARTTGCCSGMRRLGQPGVDRRDRHAGRVPFATAQLGPIQTLGPEIAVHDGLHRRQSSRRTPSCMRSSNFEPRSKARPRPLSSSASPVVQTGQVLTRRRLSSRPT